MTRRLGCTAAAVALGAVVAAQQPPASQPPRFRAGTDLVVVEATVVDRDGAVVGTLGPADFKVEFDGKQRDIVSADLVEYVKAQPGEPNAAAPEITTNEPTEQGRLVLIVVDQNSLRPESRPVLDAARRWVMALGPRDRVGLFTFPLTGPRAEFTTDHAAVADVLSRVTGVSPPPPVYSMRNVSVYEAVRMVSGDTYTRGEVLRRECRGEPSCPEQVDVKARMMVQDGRLQVEPAMQALRTIARNLRPIPGPKHVVLISSGWVMIEREAATEMSFVAAEAAKSNITFHTFTAEQWALAAANPKISNTPAQDQMLLLQNVETLSGMTGGRAIRLTASYDSAFEQLDAGLTGYYRLGVQALPQDLDGQNHRITLKVTRRGATLVGYRRVFAGTPEKPAEAVAPEVALREAVKGGPARTGVDLRATSYVLHATNGSRDLRVVAVGDVRRAVAGRATAVAALYELDGRPVTAMQNDVDVSADGRGAMSIELTAPAGTYVLRLAVLDANGKVGSLERLVEARWIKAGPLETPGLVLFRATGAVGSGTRPVFDSVTTADRLIVQVALSGSVAEDKAEVMFAIAPAGSTEPIVQRRGRIAQTTSGTTVAQETITMSAMAPGRYTLSATIRPGGAKPLTRAFTVEAAPAAPAAAARP